MLCKYSCDEDELQNCEHFTIWVSQQFFVQAEQYAITSHQFKQECIWGWNWQTLKPHTKELWTAKCNESSLN